MIHPFSKYWKYIKSLDRKKKIISVVSLLFLLVILLSLPVGLHYTANGVGLGLPFAYVKSIVEGSLFRRKQITSAAIPGCPNALDFVSIRAQLNAQGKDLAFVKIGFHTQSRGGTSYTGLGKWEQCLDAAGVPFALKAVDNAGRVLEAVNLKRASGVPHVVVYRRDSPRVGQDGQYFEVVNYRNDPLVEAEVNWQRHKLDIEQYSQELLPIKDQFWIETINEPYKGPRCWECPSGQCPLDNSCRPPLNTEWLAQFAKRQAELAIRDGYNYAAFGWSSGEPEPADWNGPKTREFLQFAAQNRNRVAIALHEYNYSQPTLRATFPFLVGRFKNIYERTDAMGLPRPTILITEFGWTSIPHESEVMQSDNIPWAAALYAEYPQVLGANLWDTDYTEMSPYITALVTYASQNYFAIPRQGTTPTPTPTSTPSFTPTPLPTSPPGSTAYVGLHMSADGGDLSLSERSMVGTARLQAAKIMSSHSFAAFDWLRDPALGKIPADRIILRMFADMRDPYMDANKFFDIHTSWLDYFYNRGGRLVEIHNEPNLIPEGLGSKWQNAQDFALYYSSVAVKIRQRWPGMRLGYPGLSPQSGSIIPGYTNSQSNVSLWIPTITSLINQNLVDWVGAHSYWTLASQLTDPEHGGYWQRFSILGRPVYITEFANVSSGVSKDEKGRQYVQYYASLPLNKVSGAFSFVSRGSDPAFAYQTWEGSNIPAIVGARQVSLTPTPIPTPTPTPIPQGSVVRIYAAGQSGGGSYPNLELLVNDQVVRTFTGVSGNYQSRSFVDLTYTHPTRITARNIKVRFPNDYYTGSWDDRNLMVDRINIDGIDYQSESPSTYSTGTWSFGNGCGPGYKQSEWLNCAGYFAYEQGVSATPSPTPTVTPTPTPTPIQTLIKIYAAGQPAEGIYPQLQLLIGNQAVSTISSVRGDPNTRVFQEFNFTYPARVSASDIKVKFINDAYSPGVYDRNVMIDRITVGGISYQSESPTTYSDGSWSASNGCGPGYKQSEWLHCAGYFQY